MLEAISRNFLWEDLQLVTHKHEFYTVSSTLGPVDISI
jgi:hypothetical protein